MNAQEGLQQYPSTNPKDWSWPFWLAVPFYPYNKRRTLCQEVIKDTIWTFDQLHGILYTIVPIRMTIVKLSTGGLLVYAPVAPTNECVRMVKELVAVHGEVKYIVLPTSSGLEHKVFVGPFARCFLEAQVFVAPHQWSFPFNLPLSWLGFPAKRTHILPEKSSDSPFAEDFDYAVLDINLGKGAFVEVAFLHKSTRTLLVTDSVLSVAENPPAILQLDPYPLLFHARDKAQDTIEDNQINRRKGWQRIALFAIYFRPSSLEVVDTLTTIRNAMKAPDKSLKAYFGFYPWRWKDNWQYSFDALRGNGRIFVAPILQTLILPQDPKLVLDWVDKIATWDFQQIISCHFDSPIMANSYQFYQAFDFLRNNYNNIPSLNSNLLPEDLKFIKELEANLVRRGIATPAKNQI